MVRRGLPRDRLCYAERELPMAPSDDRLKNVTYEDFRHLASDESLSKTLPQLAGLT